MAARGRARDGSPEGGSAMSVTDEYLRNNAVYAERFSGPLPLPPARHVAVAACVGARLNVYGILGLAESARTASLGAGHVVGRPAGPQTTAHVVRGALAGLRTRGRGHWPPTGHRFPG